MALLSSMCCLCFGFVTTKFLCEFSVRKHHIQLGKIQTYTYVRSIRFHCFVGIYFALERRPNAFRERATWRCPSLTRLVENCISCVSAFFEQNIRRPYGTAKARFFQFAGFHSIFCSKKLNQWSLKYAVNEVTLICLAAITMKFHFPFFFFLLEMCPCLPSSIVPRISF